MAWYRYNVVFYRSDIDNKTDGTESAEITNFFDELQTVLDEANPPFHGTFWITDRSKLDSLEPPLESIPIVFTFKPECYFCEEAKGGMKLAEIGREEAGPHVARVCPECMAEKILKGKAVLELERWLHE